MAIFNDDKSKQDIFDLIDKFEKSSLFEFEIAIPAQPQYTKIKMMKLAQDKSDESVIKVKIEDAEGINEELELKSKN